LFAEHWDVIDNTEMQLALGLLVARQATAVNFPESSRR